MTDQVQKSSTQKLHLWRLTTKLGWYKTEYDNKIRGRIHHIFLRNHGHPWYDWGHRVMILVGTCIAGNYNDPTPPTWWYKHGPPKSMFRTKYPRHPLSTYQIVTTYDEFRKLTTGLNDDELYEWHAIGINCDDELQLGHQYWGGTFYGLQECDVALLRRYLRMWNRMNWFGLRSWIYDQALHACVHVKKPFSCKQLPPKDSGGYDHWYCQRSRRHHGMHRYNSYLWEVNEEGIDRVVHVP